jgi:hypothetical protein
VSTSSSAIPVYICMEIKMAVRKGSFVFVLILFSCLEKPECISFDTNLVAVAFFRFEEGEEKKVLLSEIIDVSSSISYEAPKDSVTNLRLPLRPDDTETVYRLVANKQIDTISFVYATRINLISPECGAYLNFDDLTVQTHTFDSVRVTNTSIRTNISSNVEIHY